VDIVDVQSIWSCGWETLSASKDRGQTWHPLTNPLAEECLFLSFLDDQNGWAASMSELAATKDGGNNWEGIILPEEITDIAAISLRTPEAGYILDFDQTLYSTDDGGESWTARTLEIEDSDLELVDVVGPSAAIHFLDNEHGMVILNIAGGGRSKLVALLTSDGGQSWENDTVPVGLGLLFLSHDGKYLTVTDFAGGGRFTILEHQSNVESGN